MYVVTHPKWLKMWRMLYLKREDIDPECVIELAQYIRNEQMSLFNISDEAMAALADES